MNRFSWLPLAAALAFAAPAGAQSAKPAPAAKPAAQKPAPAHKSRRHEDARACLERASNTEIIKCAEAYL